MAKIGALQRDAFQYRVGQIGALEIRAVQVNDSGRRVLQTAGTDQASLGKEPHDLATSRAVESAKSADRERVRDHPSVRTGTGVPESPVQHEIGHPRYVTIKH